MFPYTIQLDYYTKLIKTNSSWEFVEVYSDEGISATSTLKRDGFNRMISDTLAGKIDLIITKSVSRFARNTVDTLTAVRKLKEKNVEVYFEKENIYTLDSKGELLITIFSSLAQNESKNISDNVTWGQRKRFADGKVSMPYKRFLGYEKGEDGTPVIVEDQAKVVREIYKLFLEGKTPSGIAKILTDRKVISPGGKSIWYASTIKSILQNEKYKGDALLQKGYCVDFLTKKRKINEGEVPQYYVENSHEPIINAQTFDLVKSGLERRDKIGKYTSSVSCFASKIRCNGCGSFYGRKVWHSNSKYRQIIWQCNSKFNGDEICSTPHLREDDIKAAFKTVFNKMIKDKDKIIRSYEKITSELLDIGDKESEMLKLQEESNLIQEMIEKMISENSRVKLDQKEYSKKYNNLVSKYGKIQEKIKALNKEIEKQKDRRNHIDAFLEKLSKQDKLLTEFDEGIFSVVIDHINVVSNNEIVFHFKDGREMIWRNKK